MEANAKYRRAEQSIITNRKEVEGQQNRINTISSELNTCTSQIDICTAAKERRGVEYSEYYTKHEKIHAAKLASIRDYLSNLSGSIKIPRGEVGLKCVSWRGALPRESDGMYFEKGNDRGAGILISNDQLNLPVFFPDPR